MRLIKEKEMYVLPIQIVQYNNFFKRFRGLMFRVKPMINEGILLTPCHSIHMFFMFISIDAIFLNDENKVIFTKENLKPWAMILPKKKAVSVLELPTGTISKFSIQVGDTIEFQ